MMECGHSRWEQRDDGDGQMTLVCLECGHQQHLYKIRDQGEDVWRDERDREDRW